MSRRSWSSSAHHRRRRHKTAMAREWQGNLQTTLSRRACIKFRCTGMTLAVQIILLAFFLAPCVDATGSKKCQAAAQIILGFFESLVSVSVGWAVGRRAKCIVPTESQHSMDHQESVTAMHMSRAAANNEIYHTVCGSHFGSSVDVGLQQEGTVPAIAIEIHEEPMVVTSSNLSETNSTYASFLSSTYVAAPPPLAEDMFSNEAGSSSSSLPTPVLSDVSIFETATSHAVGSRTTGYMQAVQQLKQSDFTTSEHISDAMRTFNVHTCKLSHVTLHGQKGGHIVWVCGSCCNGGKSACSGQECPSIMKRMQVGIRSTIKGQCFFRVVFRKNKLTKTWNLSNSSIFDHDPICSAMGPSTHTITTRDILQSPLAQSLVVAAPRVTARAVVESLKSAEGGNLPASRTASAAVRTLKQKRGMVDTTQGQDDDYRYLKSATEEFNKINPGSSSGVEQSYSTSSDDDCVAYFKSFFVVFAAQAKRVVR